VGFALHSVSGLFQFEDFFAKKSPKSKMATHCNTKSEKIKNGDPFLQKNFKS
jgi:hypothetical protein